MDVQIYTLAKSKTNKKYRKTAKNSKIFCFFEKENENRTAIVEKSDFKRL